MKLQFSDPLITVNYNSPVNCMIVTRLKEENYTLSYFLLNPEPYCEIKSTLFLILNLNFTASHNENYHQFFKIHILYISLKLDYSIRDFIILCATSESSLPITPDCNKILSDSNLLSYGLTTILLI